MLHRQSVNASSFSTDDQTGQKEKMMDQSNVK